MYILQFWVWIPSSKPRSAPVLCWRIACKNKVYKKTKKTLYTSQPFYILYLHGVQRVAHYDSTCPCVFPERKQRQGHIWHRDAQGCRFFFFIYESAADREAKCDAEEIIQPQQIFICLLHSPWSHDFTVILDLTHRCYFKVTMFP